MLCIFFHLFLHLAWVKPHRFQLYIHERCASIVINLIEIPSVCASIVKFQVKPHPRVQVVNFY